jgi:Zn-dependent protease with chaperone function
LRGRGKYYDGKSPASTEVDLIRDGEFLRIENDGATLARWPAGSIFRDPTHMVAVVIGCGSDDERIEVLNPDILTGLSLRTETWSWIHLRKYGKWWLLYAVVMLVLAVATLSNTRTITRYLAGKVSPETERAWSEKLIAKVDLKTCELRPAQQKSLDKILDRLFWQDPEHEGHVKVGIVDEPVDNAYAFPGGYIFVYTGLLEKMHSSEELAGILAHEIEHVEKRHVMESLIKAAMFTGMLNLMAGDVSGVLLVDPSTAAQIFGLRLSRDMEAEADEGSLKRLEFSHISPTGMIDFFTRIGAKDSKLDSLAFLSTHPITSERLKRFKSAPKTKSTPKLLSAAAWEDLAGACKPALETSSKKTRRRTSKHK